MNAMWELLSRPSSALAVDVAAKSTLVLAAAAVSALMLRRAPAALRHLAWYFGLCGALVLPILAFALPGWAWPVLPANSDGSVVPPAPRVAASTPPTVGAQEPAASPQKPATPRVVASLAPSPQPTIVAPAPARVAWLAPSTAILSAWLGIAALLLMLPLIGRLALWRLARGAESIESGEWFELLGELTARAGIVAAQ